MADANHGFPDRIDRLRGDLVAQSGRVREVVERAVESIFERDASKAEGVARADETIDRVDVAIERAVVGLLEDATRAGAALTAGQLRAALMVVKVNNELERIADAGVSIAEQASSFAAMGAPPPDTFRILANSVIGILETAQGSLARGDEAGAKVVLSSEEATLEFARLALRETLEGIAKGRLGVEAGSALTRMAGDLERIADHATNIAEQVIYLVSGSVTKQQGGKWTAPARAE